MLYDKVFPKKDTTGVLHKRQRDTPGGNTSACGLRRSSGIQAMNGDTNGENSSLNNIEGKGELQNLQVHPAH